MAGVALSCTVLTFERFISRRFKFIRFVFFFLIKFGGRASRSTGVEVNSLDLLFYLLLFIFTNRLSVRDQSFILFTISKHENTSLAPSWRAKIGLTY